MKLTLLLNLVCTLAITANSYSQSFTMNFENAPIKDVFRAIENQSDYRFFYNDELSDLNRVINLNINNLNINQVLNKLFRDSGISYTIMENKLIVIAPKRAEQPRTVTGRVTDVTTGEALPGVNIVIRGTATGSTTDINGNYRIEVPDSSDFLVFSYIGYNSESIDISGKTVIDVMLIADISELNEVIVVGYGTQKKTTVTGSVSAIEGENLAASPVANISNALAGRVSGLSMKSNGGQPGYDNPDIHIRGIATTGNSAPLIVVDGIIRDNINQIDPTTIESVTVLKDAAAVAPFGMGGANGVILITTKQGKAGDPVLTFSTYYGIQTPNYKPEMLSAKDYLSLLDSTRNALLVAEYDQLNAEDPDAYPNSNFYRDVAELSVPVQRYDLQQSGGDERTKYFAGIGYFKQNGIFENVGYKRYSYNLKVESDVTKTTKLIASLQGSVEEIKSTQKNPADILWQAIKFIPTDAMVYSNGLWGASDGGSPVGNIKTGGYNTMNTNTLLSNISLEQQIPFFKGLSLKGVFGYDPTDNMQKNWSTPVTYYQIEDIEADPRVFTEIIGSSATQLNERYTRWVNYTYQGFINYHRSFGDHELTILGVAEARKNTWKSLSAGNLNYIIGIDELNLGSSDKNDFEIGGGSKTGSQLGYVYRLGYNYKEKYVLEAAGRYDGHYTFAPGKRFGYFPSFSAAWRISEEAFLNDRFDWLNSLKIRASWGKSGNLPYYGGALAEFAYLNGYFLYPNNSITDPAYAFGQGTLVSGSYIPQENNPAITWETSTKTNVGFDMTLLKGKLMFEFDYFMEDRDNMLIEPTARVPVEYGLRLALENAGRMKNQGIDLSAGYAQKLTNGMDIGFTGNFSYTQNEVVYTIETDATYDNPNRRRTGRQYLTPFGYASDGLFSTSDDINRDGEIDSLDGYHVIQFNEIRPGDVRYIDQNGDGIIDAEDETVIGHPSYPSITYGFTPSFAWKGIDVSLFFQGTSMVSMYIANFQSQPFANNKSNTSYEYFDNYWRPDRQDASYPRPDAPGPLSVNNTQYSDFWMRDAGYLRLKNTVVGYTFPTNLTKRIGMKMLRVYFSGQNLLTFSKIKFIDPEEAEVNTAATYFYPIIKVYTFGLDVTF